MPAATKAAFKRKDPAPRHMDGASAWARIQNKDPERFYVFVNKGDPDALADYESAGYEQEFVREGGPKLAGSRTKGKLGEAIEMRGTLLYSISNERHAQIELEGMYGDSGQKALDAIEARILDKRGYDPLRGIRRELVSLYANEIEETKVEVGIP